MHGYATTKEQKKMEFIVNNQNKNSQLAQK